MFRAFDLGATHAPERPRQQLAEARRRIGDGKELVRVTVDGVAGRIPDNLVQLGREVVVGKPAADDVRAWSARSRD